MVPGRQSDSIRRDEIVRTMAAPSMMAEPLSHSERMAGYHGAACPPGIQFASGRNPRTVATIAKAKAGHRSRRLDLLG